MGAEGKSVRVSEWNIRFLLPDDSAAITEILRESPEAANWTEASLRESIVVGGVVALVSESRGAVTGFLLGRQVVDEAEILNISVKQTSRRQGVASGLVSAALLEFRKRGANSAYLEVRESNAAAIGLYRALGFAQRGLRKGYYRNPDEAAVLMDMNLAAQD
jgi:ribosomal-protein-alanine acetyltransferase